jgi:TM2 domain-containing membrane protein YozV
MKNDNEAFVLWCAGLLGACGLQRIYVGKMATGLLWLFTFGLLGFGQVFDLLMLDGWVAQANGEDDPAVAPAPAYVRASDAVPLPLPAPPPVPLPGSLPLAA